MRLELTLKTVVVPIFGAIAYLGVYEWSPTGGMVHLHYILWKDGAPRFDVRSEKLMEQAAALRKSGLAAAAVPECGIDDVVDFFGEYVSEWNPDKSTKGEEENSAVAASVNESETHTAALSIKDLLHLLKRENAHDRFAYYKKLVRTEHIHDYHYPDPLGAPNPSQPCAKLPKGTLNMWYCANGYPRDRVRAPCDQSVTQDALRPELWRPRHERREQVRLRCGIRRQVLPDRPLCLPRLLRELRTHRLERSRERGQPRWYLLDG